MGRTATKAAKPAAKRKPRAPKATVQTIEFNPFEDQARMAALSNPQPHPDFGTFTQKQPEGMSADDMINRGWEHLNKEDPEEALRWFYGAVRADPHYPRAHFSVAEALLWTGQMIPGWREFAWRRLMNPDDVIKSMKTPPWTGMRMPKGRLLVVCDEGFGDSIQFARYLKPASKLVDELIVGWGPEITALYGHLPYVKEAYTFQEDIPEHDAHVMICDLPGVFASTLETIPVTPYLHPRKEKLEEWGPRMRAAIPDGKLVVGVSWRGRASHMRDRERSLNAGMLQPLLDVEGVHLVGLQKDPTPEDWKWIEAAEATGKFSHFGEQFATFADTAAVIQGTHVVVSIDSAPIHLAGAMGKTAWALLPRPSEWRWMGNRADTPWYPTMRLIRQEKKGEWGPVIDLVAQDLARIVYNAREMGARV